MTNALLEPSSLPLFDRITPADVGPAIDTLIERAQVALETVTAPDFPADWNAIAKVLDVATEKLGMQWSAVSHLSSVADSPELRAAYNEALPKVTEFWTNLGADERLYAKYKAIDTATLTPEQKKAHENSLRGFVLSGAELQGADRERFAKIQERSAELAQKFSENTLDATDHWAYYATEQELDGVPEDVKQAAKAAAEADGKQGYKLTLKIPSYLPVMQFAHSSALREKLYRAYVTRASEQAEGDLAKYDNTAIIQEILALRQEEAQLLGYQNFAEVSLVPKMAQSPQQVIDFLRDLARRARPYAEKDVADLREFAAKELGITDPQPWDWTYISEKLKEARYSFSEQEVKQYFTAPKVLAGLFKIIESLFDVKIVKDEAPVWNKDVQFFRLERNGQLVGQFYLDQPARKGKRGGAWMDDVRSRWLRPDTGTLPTPVAHMVCNFADGVDGKPALLTHDDVITLFHESGHALHHMLTQVNERDVSGINGVEWDAVELPSQFMENFCWEWNVLRDMTAHVDTGEPLPRALYDKMIAAKNLHIFAGGYAAGYYSYKWAEVLSADAYAAFEETQGSDGTASQETAQKYLHNILEMGGSRSAMDNFKAFRGREPQLDALLRHQGMAEPVAA